MLKDILNDNGYKSAMISNNFDYHTKFGFIMNIERPEKVNIKKSLKEMLSRKKPNHVFNIIEEDNKIYIYDSTNLLLYDIVNSNYSNLINGKGKNRLFPYQSYGFCINEEDISLLDRLFEETSFPSPYTKEDLISTSEIEIEIIRNSITLLNDFYAEARQDIIGISEEANRKVREKVIS